MTRVFFASLFMVICLFVAFESTDAWSNFKEGENEKWVKMLFFIYKISTRHTKKEKKYVYGYFLKSQ